MSSKLIKQHGHLIDIPGDVVIVDLKVWKSGKIQLQAPDVAPNDLCKIFSNLNIDITYEAMKQVILSQTQSGEVQ